MFQVSGFRIQDSGFLRYEPTCKWLNVSRVNYPKFGSPNWPMNDIVFVMKMTVAHNTPFKTNYAVKSKTKRR